MRQFTRLLAAAAASAGLFLAFSASGQTGTSVPTQNPTPPPGWIVMQPSTADQSAAFHAASGHHILLVPGVYHLCNAVGGVNTIGTGTIISGPGARAQNAGTHTDAGELAWLDPPSGATNCDVLDVSAALGWKLDDVGIDCENASGVNGISGGGNQQIFSNIQITRCGNAIGDARGDGYTHSIGGINIFLFHNGTAIFHPIDSHFTNIKVGSNTLGADLDNLSVSDVFDNFTFEFNQGYDIDCNSCTRINFGVGKFDSSLNSAIYLHGNANNIIFAGSRCYRPASSLVSPNDACIYVDGANNISGWIDSVAATSDGGIGPPRPNYVFRFTNNGANTKFKFVGNLQGSVLGIYAGTFPSESSLDTVGNALFSTVTGTVAAAQTTSFTFDRTAQAWPCDATAGAVTGTLQSGSFISSTTVVANRTYTLVKVDSSGNACLMAVPGSNSIVGYTSPITLSRQGDSVTLQNENGTLVWHVLARASSSGVGGTVTSVGTGAGLTGGPVTTTGTISLDLTSPNTWTGIQSFSNGKLSLLGATSGNALLNAPATGGGTIALPAGTGTLLLGANNGSDIPSPSTFLANIGGVATSSVGAANGVAALDANSNVPLSQLGNTLSGLDNRIINPDFTLDGVNGGSSVTAINSTYFVNRWLAISAQANKFTVQGLQTTLPTPQTRYYLNITSSAATTVASGEQYAVEQKIEGPNIYDFQWGTSGGKSLQLEFKVKGSVAGPYCVYLRDNGSNFSYVHQFSYTSTGTWQIVQATIPAPTVNSTWLQSAGAVGLRLYFDLGAGSTFQTTTDAWQAGAFSTTSSCTQFVATNAATYQITGVRIYPASSPLPYVPRPLGQEFILASRYYQTNFPFNTKPAQNGGVGNSVCTKNPIALGDPSVFINFGQTLMATSPTITTYNPSATNANWRDVTAGADVTVSVDPGSAVSSTGLMLSTSGTVTTLGDILCIGWKAQAEL